MRIDVNGTRLWFDVEGPALVPDGPQMVQRPTVVLLHGGPGSFDHTYFKPEFARLATVAQVVYLDVRGHGRSARDDPSRWSFEACADDVRTFCDVLGITRPVVYGHSLGGYFAMLYAARHPGHAGALVLQSTNARYDVTRIVEGFARFGGDEMASIAERVYGGTGPPATAEEWNRCWTVFGPWVLGETEKARVVANRALNRHGFELMRAFDVVDRLAAIDCPALVCVGELDPVTPVAAAEEIVAALPEGTARLEVIRGAGHFPWKDAPDRYWPVVLDFVRAAGRERVETRP